MSTSLQEQLQRLALPQTAKISGGKRQTSILFDSKEAATKDRRTIFELGRSGLEQLINFNPALKQFEATLFNEETIHLERSVENAQLNNILDLNINKFLLHISPYFMIRPAHLCIEWLLRRFHVHEYNRDALIKLALPYHETNIFVRVIQTIRIKESDMNWNWLKPLQKPGVHLSKNVIITRASSNKAFFSFICKIITESICEFGKNVHILQQQINLYTSIMLGVLYNVSVVEEWHITLMAHSLLAALKCDAVDYVSAGYMIAGFLTKRASLSKSLYKAFITCATNNKFESQDISALVLLIVIYSVVDENVVPPLSKKNLDNLIKKSTCIQHLVVLAAAKNKVGSFCKQLVTAACDGINNHVENADIYKKFVSSLCATITLNYDESEEFINCFLESFASGIGYSTNGIVHNNDYDSISNPIKKLLAEDIDWYSNVFMELETKYPLAYASFEANCKNFADSVGSKMYTELLNYRFLSLGCSNISNKLNHPNELVRIAAIRTLVDHRNHISLSEVQNLAILKNSLMRCIRNSNYSVLVEVLHLPTEHCLKIFGMKDFTNLLIDMIDSIQKDPVRYEISWMLTVKHFTASALLENYDCNVILILLMTFLFPADDKCDYHLVIEAILTSDLSIKIPYLQDFYVHIEANKNGLYDAKWIRNCFIKSLCKAKEKPSTVSIIESVRKHRDRIWSNPLNISHLIVLLTSSIDIDLTKSDRIKLFDELLDLCTLSEIKYFDVRKWSGSMKLQFIDLTLIGDFCSLMVHQIEYTDLINWHHMGTDLKLFLKVICFLANQFLHQSPRGQVFLLDKLYDIISTAFNTTQMQVRFLLNFCTYSKLSIIDDYNTVRQIIISLFMFILKSKTHPYTITTEEIVKMLVPLCDETKMMRLNAIRMLKLVIEIGSLKSDWKILILELLKYEDAICSDKEVFPLTIFTLLIKKKILNSSETILNEIISLIKSEEIFEKTPYLTLELLNMIKYLDVDRVIDEVISVSKKSLDKYEKENFINLLNEPFINIVDMAMLRYSEQTFTKYLCNQRSTWELFEKILNSVDTFFLRDGMLIPLPCLAIDTFKDIYQRFPKEHKASIMKAIIKTLSRCNDSSIFIVTNEMLKNSDIDCKLFVDIISNMYKNINEPMRPGKRRNTNIKEQSSISNLIKSLTWKEGVVFLELLEGKEHLIGPEILIPELFELLRICLEFNIADASDHTMRLALSVLLNCCKICQSKNVALNMVLPNSVFRIDLIVQCVRSSSNKQTQHNALMLLGECADYFPQQVLHNIVNIFTFMGSSVVRQDDAYSLHVINNVIESIIPILVSDKSKQRQRNKQGIHSATIQVLKVFSDIMLDVPQHRRIPLYRNLLETLGVTQYMWAYLCIAFEIQVTNKLENGEVQCINTADKSKRIESLFELVFSFNVNDILQTCIELLHYIRNLPTSIEYTGSSIVNKSSSKMENIEMIIFNTNCHTPKQLRHFIYLIVQFLSKLTSSTEFLKKMTTLEDNEQELLKPTYENLILKILSYIPIIQNEIDQAVEASVNKFWRVIQNHAHDILNNAISLLTSNIFLNVIEGLMVHQYLSVRRKVLELFITKLQLKDMYFDSCKPDDFENILKILNEIIENILHTEDRSMSPVGSTSTNSHSNQIVFVQQNALIVIKLLSQVIGKNFIQKFKHILDNLLRIMKNSENVPKIILAQSVLTMVELCSNIKVHSLVYLPKFMEYLLEILKKQSDLVESQPPDSICLAIVTGIQKLFESLSKFLGPYVKNIVIMLCLMVTRIETQNLDMKSRKSQRTKAVVDKVYTIFSVIGNQMPIRIVVPCCNEIYENLLQHKIYPGIVALMKLLLKSINSAEPEALTAAQIDLKIFFLKAFNFRLNFCTDNLDTFREISSWEDSIIESNVQWLLKLPESAFRPFFNKVHHWAFISSGRKEALLTFFRLTNKLAETLKSLLALFISDFIDDIADLLNKCNTNNQVVESFSEQFCTELLMSVLETLFQLFFHNSKNYITTRRFEVLLQPISDQLDNNVVLNNDSLKDILSITIAQFAITISNELLWKQLNYQVLLKTRSNNSKVRIFAFNCCVDIARKLGQNFNLLLPDTIPFIAELLEDENSLVEKSTRRGIQELETITGESLQQYIS